ncbi:MAG: DUF4837 family protein [Bacteroidota bacterium]|jgi:hypothetical protein|nr:DUF4837 family protein [Bacteroidota bacterium]
MNARIFLVLLLALGISACGGLSRDDAMGESDVITVIADSADYDALSDVMENAFHQPFLTPQPETWFQLVRHDLADLLDHKRDRNILIIAPLDAKNRMGEYMRSALDTAVRALVMDGKEHVFVQKDLWYRGQTVVHLTGRSMDDLRDFMAGNARQLEYYFKQAWDEREIARMKYLPREDELETRLFETHGFSFSVIKSWFLAKDSSEINAVLLRRQAPAETERWLLVHWLDTANTALLTNAFAYETRNRLTEMLYRTYDDSAHVVIDSINGLQFDEVNFQNRFAIRMKGLWRMSDYSMGGPFVSYLFYDEMQQRIYFIEGSVFAPKYEKKKLLQDVDVMIQTLRLAPRKNTPTS